MIRKKCKICLKKLPRKNIKYCSNECKFEDLDYIKRLRIAKLAEKNPIWKGDKVGKQTPLHRWIARHKPKPEYCESCKKSKPYDLANISGKYFRDINDFEWLCRSCHMNKDGRMKNLKHQGDSNVNR